MYRVMELGEKYKDYIIETRRYLHMYPESSNEEFNTAKFIRNELKSMNIEYKEIQTSTIAYIRGKNPGKTVALRADIDALELEELNEVPYRSKNSGLMHACGHDGHTAALLGAAKILCEIKDDLAGNVVLIFQQAEETGSGAKLLVSEGCIEGVDSILGLHLSMALPVGTFNIASGPRMASAGIFKIHVKGYGGHGALPHLTKDATVIGSQIVNALQLIVSRSIDPLEPAVVTVGTFNSGSRFNIISNDAYITGSMRCYTKEVAKQLEESIIRIAKMTAKSFDSDVEIECEWLLTPTINDDKITVIAQKAIKKCLGDNVMSHMEKVTGSEDMSVYLDKIPGAFVFVGARNNDKGIVHQNHHSKFNIDEESLLYASIVYAGFACEYLGLQFL